MGNTAPITAHGAHQPHAVQYCARGVRFALFALVALLTLLPTTTGLSRARAATDTVTNCLDDGSAGSLRTVLAGTASGDTVNFALDCTGASAITLTRNLFIQNRDLTIDATAPAHVITLSGNHSTPILAINGGTGRFVNVFLYGLTFVDGNSFDGGAIYAGIGAGIALSLTVTGCTFTGNTATGDAGASGLGGAIRSDILGVLTVTDSTFTGNTASRGGGAIFNVGPTIVTGSTFTNNTAANGPGGAIRAVAFLSITGSIFMGNTASVGAGGAIGGSGALIVQNSTFTGNTASAGAGGAISLTSDSGGTNSSLSVTGSTVVGNTAAQGGGVSYVADGSNGSPMFSPTLALIARNTASTDPDISGTVTADGGGNVVGNASGSTGLTAGSDHLDVSPLLTPLGNYGGTKQTFALLPGSPALNAGPCITGLITDARGVARPQGANCDAGAFESQGFTVVKTGGDGQRAGLGGGTPFTALTATVTSKDPNLAVNGGTLTFAITPGATGITFGATGSTGCILSTDKLTATGCTVNATGMATSPAFTTPMSAGDVTVNATASPGNPPDVVYSETVTQATLTLTAPTGIGSGNSGTAANAIIRPGTSLLLAVTGTLMGSTVTYQSSNTQQVNVSASGVITGLAPTAIPVTIIATEVGGTTATLTVTVATASGGGLMNPNPQPMVKAGGMAAAATTIAPQPTRKADTSAPGGVQPQSAGQSPATPQAQPGRH